MRHMLHARVYTNPITDVQLKRIPEAERNKNEKKKQKKQKQKDTM